ncbi:lytic polysaccharide monooxygenase auxiliary activity family 9 protein [Streptomyces achromogenes]|uniref:lytic polysaccharide monooxygenase auxiliary activity family 9 protein n=1 Tax=Streptomyces achromogenes TaxID=67255 RepID=UPI0004C70F61|nr:lytic polysaccharide monooxygenase [Streptomyces achromogenes]
MPSSRKATASAVTVAALGLSVLTTWPASAHGTMGDPVSRVAQCYAEGPESPESAACEAAVAAGGTQALYDWNGIRIGDVAGRHRESIPDGRLCSAGNEEFKGLDLARADWPATRVHGGSYTFKYRVTAPHKGTFTVYATKPGYDPVKRLAWADLDLEHPVAQVTDPVAAGGFYSFTGTLPERSGRHLLYAVWQRSDSPEAFYSCSDVDFGGAGGGSAPVPSASAPSEEQIAAGADKSTIEHHGHGDDDARTSAEPTAAVPANAEPTAAGPAEQPPAPPANQPEADGSSVHLAETGAPAGTSTLAIGGAAALAVGSAALFLSVRRRAAGGGRRR